MRATLHNHTICSDGTQTVKDLNNLALEKNFDIVAITDHDTVDGYFDILKLDTPVRFIIGVEMSTVHRGKNVHVLGYFPSMDFETIEYFQKLKKDRITRCKMMLENLEKYENIFINYEDVEKLANGVVGRPHIAEAISLKYGVSRDDVFKKYIGNDCRSYVNVGKISTKDAVRFLKERGAIVSLAHPIQIKGFEFEEILDFGFDAIEVNHPDQNDEYRKKLRNVANRYNLIVTGGSDYHGNSHSHYFDSSYIEGEDLDIFLSKFDNLEHKNTINK